MAIIMKLLDNIEERCDNCSLDAACQVLRTIDFFTTKDCAEHDKLLCPVGIIIVNDCYINSVYKDEDIQQ